MGFWESVRFLSILPPTLILTYYDCQILPLTHSLGKYLFPFLPISTSKSSIQPFVLDIQSDLLEGLLLITLLHYLSLRGFIAGPLFIHKSSPITRSNFNGILSRALVFNGLDTDIFKSHSLRIGAATHSFLKGFSTQHVQLMGSWKSNAFAKYLRVQSFSS